MLASYRPKKLQIWVREWKTRLILRGMHEWTKFDINFLGNCIISNHRLKEEVKQEEIREIKVKISL